MILDYIVVNNFRQFYSAQKIYFSKSKEKNVTVIHGENGFGKTALLNAFKWCLYGNLDLPERHVFINERAEGEATDQEWVSVYVELCFRDKNNHYNIKRAIKGQKNDGNYKSIGEAVLTVEFKDETGKCITPKNPQNTIDQILPEKMCPYFFFDGEHIDNLSKRESSGEIQNAIKNIMGLEVLERSVHHLGDVKKIFTREFGEYATDEEKQLIQNKDVYDRKLIDMLHRNKTNNENMEALKIEQSKVDDRLREQEGAKELQAEKDLLGRRKKEIQEEIKTKNAEIIAICSKRGFLAFTKMLIDKVGTVIDAKRVKGEIPAGIKQQFVEDLLEARQCICKTILPDGSPEYEAVKAWLDKSGNKDLEDAFIQTSGNVKMLSMFRSELFDNLRTHTASRENYLSSLNAIEEELDQIATNLDNKDSEAIKDLVRRTKEIDTEYSDLHFKSIELLNGINGLKKDIQELDNEISKIRVVEAKAHLAKRRMEACQASKDLVENVYNSIARKVKNECQSKITDVYSKFMKKPYQAKLLDTYELQIIKPFGDGNKIVAMSQGERQITSLSFIGALVDIARKNYEERKKFYFGGIYPIVMDSPFGQLDPEHRKNVAEGIPSLAPQIILMVADQQWNGDIADAMTSVIGKEYRLKNFNPKNSPDVKYEHTLIEEM